ncbi:MAG: type II secretion system protein [Verrucomicrobia bacterium]|nr:type II secretion system protein [Verrucomicrobiota bacterium]
MKNKTRKKRAITLIEMIVVMLLIAMITGGIAYNYNSTLNEGKVFKTKEGMSRIKTILALAIAENPEIPPRDIVSNWANYVTNSPLAGKGADLLKDGWGQEYNVGIGDGEDGQEEVIVSSKAYEAYIQQKRTKR